MLKDDVKELIDIHYSRLQELKKQQALYGSKTDPSILLEIKNIEEKIERLQTGLGTDVQESIGQQIFAHSDSVEFRSYVENLMRQARQIVLIGTGLNILQSEPFVKEILTRAAQRECRLEIFLADPTSPEIEARLIEEELGYVKPPLGRSGIQNRLDTLLKIWKNYKHPVNTISINLFTHYPTFALLIIDREYFTYPYGYATLGNFSPVLRFSKDIPAHQDVIRFLDEQYHRVKADALDAEMAIRVRRRPKSVKVEALQSFALYFVPPENSALYQFGTEVLGYDVRRRQRLESPWQEQVAGARDFGFHVTLGDALYFLNEAQVERVRAEVQFLTEEFAPFDLTELRLTPGFPDETSLSILMDDPSGSLEALHYELVHRVYRRAAASNYSLGLAEPTRDQDIQRARLMIKRYQAPYILQRFRPHFTLLTNVPPEELSKTCQEFEKIFSRKVPKRTIRVEELAIMSRPMPDTPWVIEDEVGLG